MSVLQEEYGAVSDVGVEEVANMFIYICDYLCDWWVRRVHGNTMKSQLLVKTFHNLIKLLITLLYDIECLLQ